MADEIKVTDCALYDEVEVHHNCTVQVLRNSLTGEISVGWWRNDAPPEGLEVE